MMQYQLQSNNAIHSGLMRSEATLFQTATRLEH